MDSWDLSLSENGYILWLWYGHIFWVKNMTLIRSIYVIATDCGRVQSIGRVSLHPDQITLFIRTQPTLKTWFY